MFTLGQQVYYVNDKGYTSKTLYTIVEITNSVIIIETKFTGKRKTKRRFQIRINRQLSEKVLFFDLIKAIKFSNERKSIIESGIFPYKIGDTISWCNGKHEGKISEITEHSYIIYTPFRIWSLDPYVLDITKC